MGSPKQLRHLRKCAADRRGVYDRLLQLNEARLRTYRFLEQYLRPTPTNYLASKPNGAHSPWEVVLSAVRSPALGGRALDGLARHRRHCAPAVQLFRRGPSPNVLRPVGQPGIGLRGRPTKPAALGSFAGVCAAGGQMGKAGAAHEVISTAENPPFTERPATGRHQAPVSRSRVRGVEETR